MSQTQPLRESSINHPRTREQVLRAAQCALLGLHRIAHVGWIKTRAPFRRVRLRPGGSYVLIGLEGEGKILLDGRWQACRPGTACLAPPRVPNAFHAVAGPAWKFCWVRYDEPPGVAPVVSAGSPVKTPCQPELLASSILGLLAEAAGRAEAGFMHHWVELIHGEVRRLARPWRGHERLGEVWARVARELTRPWDAPALAALTHCSTEHLRRLCLRELGRTPMQHLTYLRVQRAAELLPAGTAKLAEIAAAVGYSDPFILSKVFKKWIGSSPAAYRAAQQAGPPAMEPTGRG